MTEAVKLLKGILRTSGWTQEQVATKLGVSFATMNAWVNGRSKPRRSMMMAIRRLYLAQDVTNDVVPTYITLVNVNGELRVGDAIVLSKDIGNRRDDEAITASLLDVSSGDDIDGLREDIGMSEEDEAELCGIQILPDYITSEIYVANSVNTVVRGTCSAGRIYDRFEKNARAQVCFVFHKMAIAKVVEWNYAG